MNLRILPAVVASLACWPDGPCAAELPPSVYEARQKAAGEHLEIDVLRVDIEPAEEPGKQKVLVAARVRSVVRSASGLEPGTILQIAYVRTDRPRGYTGPGEVPILAEGSTTVAFLEKTPEANLYAPAAGVMSFSEF